MARVGKSQVFLDNVGLYRRFGLPSVDRDWQRMFEGQTSLDVLLVAHGAHTTDDELHVLDGGSQCVVIGRGSGKPVITEKNAFDFQQLVTDVVEDAAELPEKKNNP